MHLNGVLEPLIATEDHKVWVYHGGEYKWEQVKNLTTCHFLTEPLMYKKKAGYRLKQVNRVVPGPVTNVYDIVLSDPKP